MPRPEILVTAPLPPDVLAALGGQFTLHLLWEAGDREAFIAAIAPRIRGLTASTLFGAIGDSLLAALPALEIIASFGVGYEHVDAAAAARRGVVVTNTPGVLDDEVADLTIGLLLAVLRQIPQADRFVREGRWARGAFPLSGTLRGRRVGIVGMGGVGSAVARRLAGFGVAIAYHTRRRRADVGHDWHAGAVALARASDVLIAIVPGGAATRHLIDAEVLAALGPQGVLINVSRGSVVDEDALIAALAEGTIAAAGLDVFADEPHVPAALIAMPQVVLLPHVGSASAHTRSAMARLVADNLTAWFAQRRALTPVAECRDLPGAQT